MSLQIFVSSAPSAGEFGEFPYDVLVARPAEANRVIAGLTAQAEALASLLEFRDVALLPADGGEFAMDVPPGIRVEEFDGGMLDELDMPHAMRSAIRSAASAAKAVESARDFLDSPRGPRR